MARDRVLQIPNFRLYCLLQALSIICTGMQAAVIPVFVLDETDSDTAVYLLWMATFLPFGLLVIGGAVADRYDRWSILLKSQVIALAQALALGLIAVAWSGHFNVWVTSAVLALHLLASIITAFESPARTALLSEFVPPDDRMLLEAALKYYTAISTLAWRIGLGLGGVMIICLKQAAPFCFLVNAISYLLGIGALALMRPHVRGRSRGTMERADQPLSGEGWWQSMREGATFVGVNPEVCLLFVQTVVVVFFLKRYEPLLPVFAKEELGSARYAGWLRIAMAFGAFVGFALVRRGTTLCTGSSGSYRAMVALSLVVLALFSFANDPITASLAMGAVSAALMVQESCCHASIQSKAKNCMQARIFAYRGTLVTAVEVMSLPLAWFATGFGVRPVLTVCAALGVVIAIPLALFAEVSTTTSAAKVKAADVVVEVPVYS